MSRDMAFLLLPKPDFLLQKQGKWDEVPWVFLLWEQDEIAVPRSFPLLPSASQRRINMMAQWHCIPATHLGSICPWLWVRVFWAPQMEAYSNTMLLKSQEGKQPSTKACFARWWCAACSGSDPAHMFLSQQLQLEGMPWQNQAAQQLWAVKHLSTSTPRALPFATQSPKPEKGQSHFPLTSQAAAIGWIYFSAIYFESPAPGDIDVGCFFNIYYVWGSGAGDAKEVGDIPTIKSSLKQVREQTSLHIFAMVKWCCISTLLCPLQ